MLKLILQPQITTFELICSQEADYLCKQLELAQLATDKFVAGEISFNDYLEFMELSGVDIDNYLLIIENNLLEIGA